MKLLTMQLINIIIIMKNISNVSDSISKILMYCISKILMYISKYISIISKNISI